MRIVFKVIAGIGILSFIGGLMNGMFFVFGLLLAVIFAYLGWRPEKKSENKNNLMYDNSQQNFDSFGSMSKNSSSLNEICKNVVEINHQDLSEIDINSKIDECKRKLKLLSSSYNDGILSREEFMTKKESFEIEIVKLTDTLSFQIKTKKITQENKATFDRLLELKAQGLITNEEYSFKYQNLLNSFLDKIQHPQKKEKEQNYLDEVNKTKLIKNYSKENEVEFRIINFVRFILLCVIIALVLGFIYIFSEK